MNLGLGLSDMTNEKEEVEPEFATEFFGYPNSFGYQTTNVPSIMNTDAAVFRVRSPNSTGNFSTNPNRISNLPKSDQTFIYVHGNLNLVDQEGSPRLAPPSASKSTVEIAPEITMVSLASCLKMAGIMIIVLVVVGVAANATSSAYVAHPLFLAVMTTAGVFLFLMSFGRPSND